MMLRKKRKNVYDSGGCYVQALKSLDLWQPNSKEDKLRYYGFIIDKIKIAIAADSQLDFILRPDLDDNTKNWEFFPLYYYPDVIHCKCIETDKKHTLDLANDFLIASISKGNSLIRHLEARPNDKYIQTASHAAKFFNYIDIGIMYNGIHSTSSAMYYKSGIVTASVCDFPKLFDTTTTDGVEWWSETVNRSMGLVRDYRFAVLYEIAKRKYVVEHN